MTFIAQIIIIATIASFLLNVAYKWQIIEYGQVHGNDFVSKLCSCNFCLSWWTCWLVAITWYLATGDNYVLLTPFCSTTLTKNLL